MKVNYLKFVAIIFIVLTACSKKENPTPLSLLEFPLSAVRISEGPFYQAQQTDMRYILALDPDRLLAPFLTEAGLPAKAEIYGNWEASGLGGHTAGHYLSALAYMHAATGNDTLLQRLNYMVDVLDECQKKNGNGYVGGVPGGKAMWEEISRGEIEADNFSLNKKWVPWYNMHKLYAGLRDAYLFAGNEKAKYVLIKLADWSIDVTKTLSDEQFQQMLRCEHGGMNEILADVADITGEEKYLVLAEKFSHRAILNPLLEGKDELTGLHANTQIPKVIGYKRIGDMAGKTDWSQAASFFWHTVIDHRTVSIGGNSVREHFNPADDFSSMIESNQGPETCNTYNMLRLTKLLFLTHPDASYMDYYERAMYNHILSSQDPTHGGFVYMTPMRPRHYRVYSQPQQCFWCCVGTGLENHGKYGELIYAHSENDLYVNMFIPSSLEWSEKGITLVQKTRFPYEEKTEIRLMLEEPQQFVLNIRYPKWVNEGDLEISVNDKKVNVKAGPSSYIAIDREWQSGDVVSVSLPMHTEVEYLPDSSSYISFVHGPVVLAAVTDTTDLQGLWADESRMGHIANGPLYPIESAPMIIAKEPDFVKEIKPVSGEPLTFGFSDLLYSETYKDLKLIPFFSLHEARYTIYWPVTTPDELEKKKQAMKEMEEKMLALEKQTVDQVATGEQQPESDHNFKGEGAEMGIHEGKFWRHASKWFSYDLKDPKKEAKTLRITYFGLDQGRTFDILLNGKLLKTVSLDGSVGNKFYDVDYSIPNEILDKMQGNILTLKFQAHEGSIAGGIYYVRLLR